jgi:hypothetical protein
MWVKARERAKNKEKCVNGATFLTPPLAMTVTVAGRLQKHHKGW